MPYSQTAVFTTERITAFKPGASPPPVTMAIVLYMDLRTVVYRSSSAPDPRWLVLLTIIRILACNYLARSRVLGQQLEGIAQDGALQLAHSRTPQTISYLETFGIQSARWPHLRGNLRT